MLSQDSTSEGATGGGTDKHKQMFDFRESLVIATVVSFILLLFACLLLWLCNRTHQIVQDGDLEKGEKLFEEMLNPDYKEAFLDKKKGIYNKSDRKPTSSKDEGRLQDQARGREEKERRGIEVEIERGEKAQKGGREAVEGRPGTLDGSPTHRL